jgi:LruC domain-containing protein
MSKINFYVVANTEKGRGNEIHLVDGKPTSLVNNELFGKYDDNSNGAKYYRTNNNLPWGINILQGFDYTVEKISIEKAYTNFIKWAESSGTQNQDWFMNTNANRNPENIY